MAKKERNRRAARKARQQERAERAALVEASSAKPAKGGKKSASGSKKAPLAKADKPRGGRVTTYFRDVRSEMRKVTWPTGNELRSYSVAVIVTLVILGIVLWLVDTGFVAGLVQYTSLRG